MEEWYDKVRLVSNNIPSNKFELRLINPFWPLNYVSLKPTLETLGKVRLG